jgi:hypothetical protein
MIVTCKSPIEFGNIIKKPDFKIHKKVDKAKEEFKNLFKQKTGGNNFEDISQFSRVQKKYNLIHVNYVTATKKDLLIPFDY